MFVWQSRDKAMNNFYSGIKGVFLALLILSLQWLSHNSVFFMLLPLFMVTYLSFNYSVIAMWFLGFYTPGMILLRFVVAQGLPSWMWSELLALWLLFFIPFFLGTRLEKIKGGFEDLNESKKKEFEEFKIIAENLKKENSRIDKQLREIGRLYDVIKDLGTTLNAQEMLDLIKEFTERMFDLPHFIIAVLSSDNPKYDLRVTSGCDENFLSGTEIDVNSNQLLAVLAREKKPVLVSPIEPDSRFDKLGDLLIGSFLFIPFVIQDRVIGFLCSYSSRKDFLDQEKFSNFQIFYNQIAIGLQKSLLYEKVQKLSVMDGLTKLYSHRYFKQRLEEEVILAGRYNAPLSLLILDIDHFKKYNDQYGHVAGDHVLTQVAGILKGQAEATHLAARYGGEEMVLIAPEMTKHKAVELAERIRSNIETHVFVVGQETTGLTVSIGVATFPEDASTGTELISRADQALYAGKNGGRNKVVSYPF
ncbi:MAG TPA: sensor domain-containing diguanylate cyclase [bacterium]|nr:sensor domain-containing diguanylate cyclase [bacterium]